MGAVTPKPSVAPLRRLAERQGGHVTRRQLLALGFTADAIKHMLARGLLVAVFRGVYAVGRLATAPIDRAHAALLAAGGAAALSHSSAAALWGIYRRWSQPFEVVTPRGRRTSGLIVHESARLLPVDLPLKNGLRVTSQARTILDVAPKLSRKQLIRAINDQRFDHGMRLESLEDIVARFPRNPGASAIKSVVASAPDEPFRSPWEIEWPDFAAAHRLPAYDMNVQLLPNVIADIVFRPDLLVVELDGWGAHGLRHAFHRDRKRDRVVYAELGIPTFRLTREDMLNHAAEEAARLHAIIDRRRRELATSAPRPGDAAASRYDHPVRNKR